MQIYLDTANLNEIQEVNTWGILDGVTTNPSRIKKEVERLKSSGQAVDLQNHLAKLLQIAGEGVPVSLEVTAVDAQGMITQGKKLHAMFNSIAENVVIKIPVCTSTGNGKLSEGLKAIHALSSAEIPVNATLIFTPEQALLAARAGASYVSPFLGRLDDYIRTSAGIEEFDKGDYFPSEGYEAELEDGEEDILDDNGIVSGVDLVTKIADIFEKNDIEDCDIIAASLRNARQTREAGLAGAQIVTLTLPILAELLGHEKTSEGIQKFTADIVPEYQALVGGDAPQVQKTVPQQSTPQTPPTQPPAQPRPVNPQSQSENSSTPSAHDLIQGRQGQ